MCFSFSLYWILWWTQSVGIFFHFFSLGFFLIHLSPLFFQQTRFCKSEIADLHLKSQTLCLLFLYMQAQVQILRQLDTKYLDNQVNARQICWQPPFYIVQSIRYLFSGHSEKQTFLEAWIQHLYFIAFLSLKCSIFSSDKGITFY